MSSENGDLEKLLQRWKEPPKERRTHHKIRERLMPMCSRAKFGQQEILSWILCAVLCALLALASCSSTISPTFADFARFSYLTQFT